MAAVPLCASLVAVMVAGPTVAPLTSPLPLTVATAVLLDAQVTVRPVSVLPFASLRVAVSWNVRPVGTEAEAGVTVTAAVPLRPSLVAVIVAEPAAAPLTRPLLLTVATAVLLLDHVTLRPDSRFPFASLSVAVSCTAWPACTVADAGVTVTDATGAGGVLDEIVKLHSVCVPDSVCNAQLSSADTGGWSVRNAKPVPIVSSALPAGVT